MSSSAPEIAIAEKPSEAPTSRFFPDPHGNEPIRAELYGLDHLEAHARLLAACSAGALVVPGRALLRRFARNSRALISAHGQISEAYQRQEKFGSDAEWLLDNFHIISDTLGEIRTDLPRGYYKLLPKIGEGDLKGFPRVYALAFELIAHTDSCLDETHIARFIQAYQTVTALTIGELWAVPIMLRLVLVDNLRRLANQILQFRFDRMEAKAWAGRLSDLQGTASASGIRGPLPFPRDSKSNWSDPFVVHLLELLRDQASSDTTGIESLEHFLDSRGTRTTEVLQREQQRQAANQVSIGNCVTSLRVQSALDWTSLFERTSLVEAVLREDPAAVYERQDFPTRDRYRRTVEKLARGSGLGEVEAARHVVAMAKREKSPGSNHSNGQEVGKSPSPPRQQSAAQPSDHVGYYLVDEGRKELETEIHYSRGPGELILHFIILHARKLYFGSLFMATAVLVALLAGLAGAQNSGPIILTVLVAVALVPASELALSLINLLAGKFLPPRILPKLSFKDGVPPEYATIIVMPTMLVRPESAAVLLEHLEIHYLSNPDPMLSFALLTDFSDAPQETMPEDEGYVRAALTGIKELNARYCKQGPDRFFLFHRRRLWNPVQERWMGWERKRGKLEEFNRLVRGATDTSFATISGDLGQLPGLRFVITLDADTRLPHETARRLIATLAHPLNQPKYDSNHKRVVRGYGILQPRVSMSLTGARKSAFARIFAGSAGIDPYTTAVSDTYQDLFGIGSFTGKGIYDIDAFVAAVENTFPENHILSHDLIEGNYVRCGLVTDLELIDEFPTQYEAHARRDHRWVRGDWQILSWLFPRVPGPNGTTRRNPLPALERWKILDNLRRSLLAPSLLALLLVSWTILPGPIWLGTAAVAIVLVWPAFQQVFSLPFSILRALFWDRRTSILPENFENTLGQGLLSIVFLADQARRMVDAILRTLVRLFITHHHMLEWETAATTARRLGAGLGGCWRNMWFSPLFSVLVGLGLYVFFPNSLPVALPVLMAWLASPVVAFWISRPTRHVEVLLTAQERRYLHRLARQTWSFFEKFVEEEDHWLPPDNYQEDPKNEVAHRTSPTNIGLYLLSSLAAHDFGYLSLSALVTRLEKTFDTLDKLEHYHGHFHNWYDTQTLNSLHPVFISTVDSGNLLGCLLALKQGLIEKTNEPIPTSSIGEGLRDVVDLAGQALRSLKLPHHSTSDALVQVLEGDIQKLRLQLEASPGEQSVWKNWLDQLEEKAADLTGKIKQFGDEIQEAPEDLMNWAQHLSGQIRDHRDNLALPGSIKLTELKGRCQALIQRAEKLAKEMDFKVLYNEKRHLFSVGYNLSAARLDEAHYDLLASEACLTSFLAVARGDVPKKHWFQLSRPLSRIGGSVTLLSWGGTMFEYLMPRLLLRSLPETLLDESQIGAVNRQIEYGRQCHVPWGISESAFFALDGALNYQYQAFGVPGLGLKRGLAKDLVIAPYATALAVVVSPRATLKNLQSLAKEGGEGRYGFYEAIDYTRDRLQPKRKSMVVKCFMAHHQGMSLVALANYLLNNAMPRRFHAEPMVRAAELFLQERVPQEAPLVEEGIQEMALPASSQENLSITSRRLTTPHTLDPHTHLLSSGQYTVMVTNAGSGFSTCRGLDVTRWREDRTCDAWGQFCYVRDVRGGQVWSAGYQPIRREADSFEVVFSTDKAEFRRMDCGVETHLEITVSPENHAEVRRLTFTNHDSRSHYLEVTSYAEIVLGPRSADLAHPAFGKLFLETEYAAAEETLLCRRRPRDAGQKPVWTVHVMVVEGETVGGIQYETDRGRFLGRGRTPANPAALDQGAVLSGTTGAVLDPILSLRRQVRIPRNSSVSIAFTTAVADSREEALALADHYHNFHGVTRAFELAWAHSQVELRHLNLSAEEAHLFQRLAAHMTYAGPALRASPSVLAANRQGQPGLWRHGISGDLPIILVRIGEVEELGLFRQVLAAHIYWRLKGLESDLVVLNEHESGYFEDLHQELQSLVRGSEDRALVDKPGGVFVRKSAQMTYDDRVLLQAAARCVLLGERGSLAAQMDRLQRQPSPKDRIPEKRSGRAIEFGWHAIESKSRVTGPEPLKLQFANGIGGFTPDGREYIINLPSNPRMKTPQPPGSTKTTTGKSGKETPAWKSPPAPWINVVSNPSFGFLVSESGAGYTWAGNSQTNRLTPWRNDPVSDTPSEVVYLRDETTKEVWTATPLPMGSAAPCQVRHGQGYTAFEQMSHGLRQELVLFVPVADPVKLICLRVKNLTSQARRLSATYYAEWVLGTVRESTAMHIATELDAASGALLARNPFNPDYGSRVAFANVSLRPRRISANRTEFLGRNGSLAEPAALIRAELSGAVGAGFDPCAALQAYFDLKPGEEKEIVFTLGQTSTIEEVRRLVKEYDSPDKARRALQEVQAQWEATLGAIQVRTPNPAMDLLLNRWLLYQVLSCRVWGRSALYQSGGAYGFRDQLQDVMALIYGAPQESRSHILRAARRQFLEGDVQHWWHPQSGNGVRTRFSDDYLWLPFVVCHYVNATGDTGILEERIPFLKSPLLRPEQEEDYRIPEISEETATLYEHCVRAIDLGFRFGAHGLPLMGSGDWNDGMNRVGSGGQGESVWNGWFLLTILRDFVGIVDKRGNAERASLYRETAKKLKAALEEHAWDGQWYRRAYFDDGTPLGSAENEECRIDSITQSWAVISGAADPQRVSQAMISLEKFLVRQSDKLVLLFTPPFDRGKLNPGYIKGYVPGIRENGGQYTHAAAWVVQAAALLGQGDRAMELFDLLNPILHADTPSGVDRYRVEPYVVAADVYSEPPHVGRGGWTWYTGSASWFYRVALETLLGFRLSGAKLSMNPCIPRHWQGFEIDYRYGSTMYLIKVNNPAGAERGIKSLILDGQPVAGSEVELVDNQKKHLITITM